MLNVAVGQGEGPELQVAIHQALETQELRQCKKRRAGLWALKVCGNKEACVQLPPSTSAAAMLTCMTCAAKPPMDPSSTVIITGCSFASRRSMSVSSGLQKRASTTVAETPACSSHRRVCPNTVPGFPVEHGQPALQRSPAMQQPPGLSKQQDATAHLLQQFGCGQAIVHWVAVANQGNITAAAPQPHFADLHDRGAHLSTDNSQHRQATAVAKHHTTGDRQPISPAGAHRQRGALEIRRDALAGKVNAQTIATGEAEARWPARARTDTLTLLPLAWQGTLTANAFLPGTGWHTTRTGHQWPRRWPPC